MWLPSRKPWVVLRVSISPVVCGTCLGLAFTCVVLHSNFTVCAVFFPSGAAPPTVTGAGSRVSQGLALLEHPEAVGAGGKYKQLLHLSLVKSEHGGGPGTTHTTRTGVPGSEVLPSSPAQP